jgi:hypothetical protein
LQWLNFDSASAARPETATVDEACSSIVRTDQTTSQCRRSQGLTVQRLKKYNSIASLPLNFVRLHLMVIVIDGDGLGCGCGVRQISLSDFPLECWLKES